MRPLLLATFLMVLMLGLPAYADETAVLGAKQAATLFTQCLRFAGDAAGLRAWIPQSGMRQAPDDQARRYLAGQSGQVFGANSPSGSIAMGSQDDGGCSLFVDHADAEALHASFESWLSAHGFSFQPPQIDVHPVAAGVSLTARAYAISGMGRKWRVVISTTPPGGARFEAVMTAYSVTD